MSHLKKIIVTTTALSLGSSVTAAPSDIMFIVDGSGSMWGQIDGVAKIQTAKDTMTDMLDDVPADARIGLMTYGTTDKASCTDVKMLNVIGLDRAPIKASIAGITPLGKTPIGQSLTDGMAALANTHPTDTQKSLVLVSDGIETCNSNPCEIAATAKDKGINLKVHVVGFDVDAEARKQLECIANAGGGKYFDASNTDGFKKAIDDVVKVAQVVEPEVKPEPTGPVITEFYRDDFEGEELSEDWAITEPNPENFIVDEGVLTMLSVRKGGFESEEPENLLTFTKDLPKGDWDIEVTFTGEYSTYYDRLVFGLRKDHQNYFSASYYSNWSGTGCAKTELTLNKVSNGKVDSEGRLFRANDGQCYVQKPFGNEDWEAVRAEHLEKPMKVVLSKRGRGYTTKAWMEGKTNDAGELVVVETDKFTALRSPGELSLTVDRYKDGEGEVFFNIDSVVINTVE